MTVAMLERTRRSSAAPVETRRAGAAGGVPRPGLRRRSRPARASRAPARGPRAAGQLPRSRPPAVADAPPIDQPLTEEPGTVDRPLQAPGADRRRGHGPRLRGRAAAARCGGMVALKIIKPGMDSRQVVARFEAERQALAMMDHQNIAKVFDAGTTEAGRPYFVMELVRGMPDHRVSATRSGSPSASGWSCSSRSARRCSTRTRRGSSTATSSPPTSWSRCTTACRSPR